MQGCRNKQNVNFEEVQMQRCVQILEGAGPGSYPTRNWLPAAPS